jgi:hypothetical protein
MRKNSSLPRVGIAFALCFCACGGDKDPEPCPSVPPCITGSTWNATVCACILDDEIPDAARDSGADHAIDAPDLDAGAASSDSPDETTD